MTHDDYAEFVEVWSQVHDLYGKVPSDGAIEIVFNAMSGYTMQQVRRALNAHVRNTESGRFAPKPADLIAHIDGDTNTQALNEWSKVEQAIRSVGPYQSVVFDDPRTMCVIQDMGGWIKMCDTSEKQLPFTANEFAKRFAGMNMSHGKQHPSRLKGLTEINNAGEHAEHIPRVILIGDSSKAEQVYRLGINQQLETTPLGVDIKSIGVRTNEK